MRADHLGAVQARAAATSSRNVTPANWRERRALRRLEARGLAAPLASFPDVWTLA